MIKVFIGIDPGVDGGIAILKSNGKIKAHVMPSVPGEKSGREIDMPEVCRILRKYKRRKLYDVVVYLERAQSRPVEAKGRIAKTFTGWGQIQGICTAFGFGLVIVSATVWYKKFKFKKDKSAKRKPSIAYIKKRFPKLDLRRSERAVMLHDGKADAACLALYGALVEGE